MPSSSAVVRSFALAMFGFGAASAFAQNVTAFNPYSGSGLSGGPAPSYGAQAAYPIMDTVGPGAGPAGGPAFNPWQSGGPAPMAGPGATAFNPGVGAFNPSQGAFIPPGGAYSPAEAPVASSAPASVGNRGSYLPAPPPGRIESRLVAIPERGTARIPRDLLYSGSAPAAAAPAAAAPAPLPASVAIRSEPAPPPSAPVAPTPTPVARPTLPPAAAPVVAAPVVTPPVVTPPPAPAARPAATPPVAAAPPAPPPAPAAVASAAPPPATPPRGVPITTQSADPASKGATVATIPFAGQSADLSDVAKSELDRVAKNISEKSLRQVELRAFASGADPDSRKIALARALVVRSYLIDRGVKSRIEVGGFAGEGERVDIMVPNT